MGELLTRIDSDRIHAIMAHLLPLQSDRWIFLLRCAWLILALVIIMLSVSVLAIPISFQRGTEACESEDCLHFNLMEVNRPTPEEACVLSEIGFSLADYALYQIRFALLNSLATFSMAVILFWSPANYRMARFMGFLLLWASLYNTPIIYDLTSAGWRWVTDLLLNAPDQMLFVLTIFLFPDGRFRPAWVAPLAILRTVLQGLGVFFPRTILNEANWSIWLGLLFNDLLFAGLGIYTQIFKYRNASDLQQRRQTKIVALAISVIMPLMALTYSLSPALGFAQSNPLRLFVSPSLAMAPLVGIVMLSVAILHDDFWMISTFLNRALVYGSLTIILGSLYILVVGTLSIFFRSQGSLLIALVGTGLVALVLHPLWQRLQRIANSLMYEQREHPSSLLAQVRDQLESTLEIDLLLPTIARTLSEGISLPNVAIKVVEEEGFRTAADAGVRVPDPRVFPITFHDQLIGQLVLGRHQRIFWNYNRSLLADVIRKTGTAIHMIQLTADLKRSREAIVTVREEERLRLRRDIHDGLGPALATQLIQMEAARDLAQVKPGKSADLLADVIQDTQSSIGDVRRLVDGLRPPSLDELGLLGTLRSQAEKYAEADGS